MNFRSANTPDNYTVSRLPDERNRANATPYFTCSKRNGGSNVRMANRIVAGALMSIPSSRGCGTLTNMEYGSVL
ncbi:MAG: hypothetical protein ACLQVY_21565 [Limisphaerales bacterium]